MFSVKYSIWSKHVNHVRTDDAGIRRHCRRSFISKIPMSSVTIWCSVYSCFLDDNIWQACVGYALRYLPSNRIGFFIAIDEAANMWIYKCSILCTYVRHVLASQPIWTFLWFFFFLFSHEPHYLFPLIVFNTSLKHTEKIQLLSIFKPYLKVNRSITKICRERNFICSSATFYVVIYIQLVFYVKKKKTTTKNVKNMQLNFCFFLLDVIQPIRDYLSSFFCGYIQMS